MVGTGTGNRVIFRSRPRFPDPSRRWFLFPPSTIPSRGDVPVPTISRRTVCPLPDCFPSHGLPSCSNPTPTFAHNFSHPASQYIFGGCYFRSVYHRFSLFLIMDATILCYFEFNSRGIFPSRYSFMCFVMFPLPKRVCFPP